MIVKVRRTESVAGSRQPAHSPARARGRRDPRPSARAPPLLYRPAMSEKDAQPSVPGPGVGGRLTREAAVALLEGGNELLASGDFGEAAQHFSRVVGFDDPAITAAA